MTTKIAEKNVDSARGRLEKAEAELSLAELALAKAEVVPAALEVRSKLKTTTHLLWVLNNMADWEEESEKLLEKSKSLEDELACLFLGAGDRLKNLHALDPYTWNLATMHPRDFATDEDVSHAIATAIFDKGHGRGSETAYEELSSDGKVRFDLFSERAEEIFGEAGKRGFALWAEGRHDT